MSSVEVLDLFHPVIKEWFKTNIGEPSPPQVEGWPAIKRGENVLITAPTGAGKTLSAFLQCIDNLFVQGLEGRLQVGVQILYISPLKALGNDIYRNLEKPLEGIRDLCSQKGIAFPEITKAVRTGDTPASERQRMRKRPPHILISTPESLYLLLTSRNSSKILQNVKYVIIDEIHSLLGNKRGVHLALSMERLAHLTGKPFTRIGLSATVKPIEEAARYLGGYSPVKEVKGMLQGNKVQSGSEFTNQIWEPRPVTLVQPDMRKEIELKIEVPMQDLLAPDGGTIWPNIYDRILELIREHKSTLVFVNNRSLAEKVTANLNYQAEEVIARTHHGCISRETRLEVEQQLKNGELTCLVATSSLELGIDIGAVDLVVQISSPKSAARGLQRLGRAGHRKDAVSKCSIIPRTRADLLESAVVSELMLKKKVEEERVPRNCLDILAQQLVAMVCVDEWTEDELFNIIRGAYSYKSLKREEFEKVLSMLSGDYEHDMDKPGKARLVWDRINHIIRGNGYSRLLAIGSGGTIPDQGFYRVYLEDGKTNLGELDEQFVFEARIGDRFMLGSSAWKIIKIGRDRVTVAPSGNMGAKTPFWQGDGLGRPYEFGVSVGTFLQELSEKAGTPGYSEWVCTRAPLDYTGVQNLERYILEQKEAVGYISSDKRLVVESFCDEVGERRVVIHSPFGGRVNAGLAIMLEHNLARALHCQVETSYNDDALLIHFMGHTEHPTQIFSLLSSRKVEEVLIDKLPSTPLFGMVFRYNANRALMMGSKAHGRRSPLWIQRLRALELLQIVEKFTDHPLIIETYRECMDSVLDVPHIVKVLEDVESGKIKVVECQTTHPSPFTSELLFSFMGVMMYEKQIPDPQKLQDNIISGVHALNLDVEHAESGAEPDVDSVIETAALNNPLARVGKARNPDELHEILLTYGDLKEDEFLLNELEQANPGRPDRWLKELETAGRAVRIQAGDSSNRLWIAAEQMQLYMAAFSNTAYNSGNFSSVVFSDLGNAATREEALSRILRRFARYYSPFTLEDAEERYCLGAALLQKLLNRMEEDEILVKGRFTGINNEEWCHTAVYDRAKRRSLYQARKAVVAKKPSQLAAFMPVWQGVGREVVSQAEALYDTIVKMQGLYLPVEWWEDFVFPSRVKGYRKNHIDSLCTTGRVFWRVNAQEGIPKLAWYLMEDMGEDTADISSETGLDEKDFRILEALGRKGACFLQMLSAAVQIESGALLRRLENLVWKGIVVNDSYASVRHFIEMEGININTKRRGRVMGARVEMGRWELATAVRPVTMERQIELWLQRYGIIAKEILQMEESRFVWKEVYDMLKQWEYIGKVKRGYFIEGLSGVQFILPEAMHELEETGEEFHVLSACDPAMVYGKMLPHVNLTGDNLWVRMPGTVIVLRKGNPVLILEKYGDRVVPVSENEEELEEGLKAFAAAFQKGSIWAGRKKVKVKQWMDSSPSGTALADTFKRLGFEKEVSDMVLWRRIV